MLYTIFVVLIIVALVLLTVLGEKRPANTKLFFFLEMSLAVIGIAMIATSHIVAVNRVNNFRYDSGFYSWVTDFYNLYYSISLPAFILLLITNAMAGITSSLDRKQSKALPKVLRLTVSIASSVLLMLLPYYSLFTENNHLKIYVFIMISGIGQALVIRISNMLGYVGQLRRSKSQ